jgi:hypothetical protein
MGFVGRNPGEGVKLRRNPREGHTPEEIFSLSPNV